MKTQILHKMKYDLKGCFNVIYGEVSDMLTMIYLIKDAVYF